MLPLHRFMPLPEQINFLAFWVFLTKVNILKLRIYWDAKQDVIHMGKRKALFDYIFY
jgi:hypothetical protein